MSFFLNRDALSTAGEQATAGAPTGFGENYAVNFEAGRKLESLWGLQYEFQEADRKNRQEIEKLTGEKMGGMSINLATSLSRRYAGDAVTDDEIKRDAFYSGVNIEEQDKKFSELKQRYPQIKTRQEVFESIREKAQELNALRDDVSSRAGFWGSVGGFAGGALSAFSERDPVNVATLGLGGFGRSLAVKILSEAGLNSAVEAIDQFTGVMENKRLLGVPTTYGQVAFDIAAAGVGAGVIRGGIDVGVPIAKQTFSKATELAKISTDSLLQRFRAEAMPETAAPSVRAVETALEREAEFIERSNPMMRESVTVEKTPEGDQVVLPGAERISDGELAARKTEATLVARAPQSPPDEGLFDIDARNQQELFDAPKRTPVQAEAIHSRALAAAEESLHGFPERFDTIPLPNEREIAEYAARVDESTAAFFKDAFQIKEQLQELRLSAVDVNNPNQLKKALGFKPRPLSQFIKEKGGITDPEGELASRGITYRTLPGLLRKEKGELKNRSMFLAKTQRQADYIIQQAVDAGYFPGKTYDDVTHSDLYDAIAGDLTSKRHYNESVTNKIRELQYAEQTLDDFAREGFSPEMSVDDIARMLVERDDQAWRDLADPGIEEEIAYRRAIQPDTLEQVRQASESFAEREDAQMLAEYADLTENIDENAIVTIQNADGDIVSVTLRELLDDVDSDDLVVQAMKTCGIKK